MLEKGIDTIYLFPQECAQRLVEMDIPYKEHGYRSDEDLWYNFSPDFLVLNIF